MAAQDQGLAGIHGDADKFVRMQFGNSVCGKWMSREALAGSTQWRAMADVILAADYLKRGPVVQQFFEELLVACWANAGIHDGDGGAQRVRAVLAMIHKLGTSHQGVRNALSHQLAMRTDSLTDNAFSSTHRALLFMALAVGAEAGPVAEKLVRHAVRTTCNRPPGTQDVGRKSVICALSGRSYALKVLLPPALRDELRSLVARLTFNVPFDLVEQGAGHYAEWGGFFVSPFFSDALDKGGPSATAVVNFLVEYVGVKIVFIGKTFGGAAETKGCATIQC